MRCEDARNGYTDEQILMRITTRSCMAIFKDQGETPEKSDFEKIGVNTIRPFKSDKGRWVFRKDGRTWDMAPAGVTEAALSPIVVGADRLISVACQLKGIKNPEKGFLLLFSEQYFPGADAKFVFSENKFDGWVYNVESVNLEGIMAGQQAWICPYMKFYFETPPRELYLKVEADDGNSE